MFYSLLELAGAHGLHAEVIVRAFPIVYGHPLFAALMLVLVVVAFRRDRILAACLGGCGPYVLLGVLFVGHSYARLNPWVGVLALILWLLLLRPVARARGVLFAIYLVFAGMYVATTGLWFSNISSLSHAQFDWDALRYLESVARSLGLALPPVGVLYLVARLSRRSDAPSGKVCLLMIPVFYTAMAVLYVPMQVAIDPCLIE